MTERNLKRYEADMTIRGKAVVYAYSIEEAQEVMSNARAMYAGNKMIGIERTQHGPVRGPGGEKL